MSKKYNVYGMGNALVDMEFEVTAEQLTVLGVDKGVMTLMDEEKQAQVVADLPPACKKCCGGSAANTMVAISQLGGTGFYSCKVANDETGTFYLQDLVDCGLDTNLTVDNRPDGVTGKCLVMVTPDADRTMGTFLGITSELSDTELDKTALADSEYVYIEGYLVTSDIARKTAIAAKKYAQESGVKTAFSLSDPNMTQYFKEGLLEIIGDGVDLLFANESEALTMAGSEKLEDAIAYLKTIAKTFAITRGKEGSVIFDGEQIIEVAGETVEAIDTVGAGDMYAGCLLYGITNGLTWEQAGSLASIASATLVTNYGARLDTDILKSLIDRVKG